MKRICVICLIIALTFSFALPNSQAASLFTWSTQQLSISTNYDLCMGLPAAFDAGDRIEITWPTGFDISGLNISDTANESEIEVYIGSLDCSGTARVAEATQAAANDRDYATSSGQTIIITFEDSIAGNMSIKFVDKTDETTTSIVSPATAGNYVVVARAFSPTNEQKAGIADFLYVGGTNQININGTIDPTLSLAVVELGSDTATTSCPLGTLSIENIETCGYRTKVSTNADSGYTAYVRSNGAFTSGSHDLTDVEAADDIDAGVEEYGISSSDTDADIIENTSTQTCVQLDHQATYAMPADPLTISDQSVRTTAASIDSEYTTICHAAGISGYTPAGYYTQVVILTVVGNF